MLWVITTANIGMVGFIPRILDTLRTSRMARCSALISNQRRVGRDCSILQNHIMAREPRVHDMTQLERAQFTPTRK